MRLPEFDALDATELARLVLRGEVTAAELLEAAIERIAARDPPLAAVTQRRFDAARREADTFDAFLRTVAPGARDAQRRATPFAGVPLLVKDIVSTIAGEPTGSGNPLLASVPRAVTSTFVVRLREAGFVVAGRTATPEFGLNPYTEPQGRPPTRNPWSLAHSPGGSSGGSAAAVAARMVPAATGTDGGGSIRIPASCCGLFGFKPSRGLVPTGPELGELWRGFTTEHALTRSVRDSAAILDAVAGDEPGAPYAAPAGAGSFLAAARAARPGELRVAFTTRALVGSAGTKIDPVCVDAAHDAVRLLRSIGHSVDEAAPQLDGESLANAFVTILAGEAAAETHQMAALIGRPVGPADLEPATWTLVLVGRALSAETYARAAHEVQRAGRVLGEFFGRYDVLLTPTLARPPLRVGELALAPAERLGAQVLGRLRAGRLLRAMGIVEQVAARSFEYLPFTPLFNVTGLPAMSLPLANTDHGLPVGVQVAGRFGDDARLFALAAQLESVRGWSQRMPPALGA